MPVATKISAQDEATILARHAAGEPLLALDYGVSHQALSKRLKRARDRQAQQPEPQPQLAAEPADEHVPALGLPQAAGLRPAAQASIHRTATRGMAWYGCAAAERPAGSTRSPSRRGTRRCSPKDSPAKSSGGSSPFVGSATAGESWAG